MQAFKMASSDGTILSSYKFIPDKVQGVFVLLHGSIEHAKRYFDFCEYLCNNNIAVYTFDQRGHGRTAYKDKQVAYFSDKDDGWFQSIEDVKLYIELANENHKGVPVTLFGHSMGSFLARSYIAKYPDDVQKVVLCGTADSSRGLIKFAYALSNFVVKIRGRRYRSKLIHKLVYGTLNDRIKNPRTDYDFITHDNAIVDKYIADDRCGNLVTCEYAREMLGGILFISEKETYNMVNKKLPIFIVAGEDDPLAGKDHVDLNRTIDGYKNANIADLSVKIYDGMRHEILNEVDKQIVYQDIKDYVLK